MKRELMNAFKCKFTKTLVFVGVIFSTILLTPEGSCQTLDDSKYHQIDPHGEKDLDLKSSSAPTLLNSCTVCHKLEKNKIILKINPEKTCSSCHNQAPHSGVAEHLSKTYTNKATGDKESITCLSCHSPHRASGITFEKSNNYFGGKVNPKLENSQFSFQQSESAMLKRSCTDCHTR